MDETKAQQNPTKLSNCGSQGIFWYLEVEVPLIDGASLELWSAIAVTSRQWLERGDGQFWNLLLVLIETNLLLSCRHINERFWAIACQTVVIN